MNSSNGTVWKVLEKDKYLGQFLNPSNVSKEDTAENVTVLSYSLTASEQLAALTKGINLLEKELQSQIYTNYPQLISQTLRIDNLQERVYSLQSETEGLLTSINLIKDKLNEPFNEIETQIRTLKRLHETSTILRCVTQIQQLVKVLQTQDPLQASILIKETDKFCKDIDLTGIDVLQEHIRVIENERRTMQQKSTSSLIEALNAENESQAAIDIQVLLNLNVLKEEIRSIVEKAVTAIEQSTKAALDIQSLTTQSAEQEKASKLRSSGPGRITGSTFPGVNMAAFRTKLWSNWSGLLEGVVYPKCVQMYILQYVITKHSESELNPESVSVQINEFDITTKFWNQVSDILSKYLICSAENSSFIKQTLEGEYPRLLKLHTELNQKLEKVISSFPIISTNGGASVFFKHSNHFAEKFENAYLSRSVSKLLDEVHTMFSGEGLPSQKELDNLLQLITNELSASMIDERLCKTVIRNVGKAMRLFCLKSEQLIAIDGNATQVIDALNSAQQTNVNIANTLYYVKTQIKKILYTVLKLPESGKNEITKEFSHLDELSKNIVEPLKTSVNEAIESIILTVHQENFNLEAFATDTAATPSSAYLRELQAFTSRARSVYLKPFNNQEIVQKCCTEMASRCVDLFLIHTCLVRNVGPGGRQKLSEDFNKFETAISSLCPDIKILGEKYKISRSFRTLITCTSMREIADHELVGKPIPYSLVVMYLFSFAPPEIPSPHESCNWSIARLSQWLDNHKSERERLELASGALQRYQQNIKQMNAEPHESYSILYNLLNVAFRSL